MHPDLQLEQEYFDLAHKYREAHRARLLSGDGSAAAVPKAGAAINRSNAAALERLGSPNDPVAMQRFDAADGEFDGAGSVVYIGRCTILDDDYDPVVIAWQSDLAAGLLQATRDEPGNVARKRTFETERNTIVDIRDDRLVVRVGEEHEIEIGPDPLLRELARSRDGRLTDMVEDHPGGTGPGHATTCPRCAGHPGWAGYGQDRGRPPANLRAHLPRSHRPDAHAVRRAEQRVHKVRGERASGAR